MSDPEVYVSMTTIFQRQRQCAQALLSLTQQTLQPKQIYVFVSEKPYLLDKGIRRYCLDPTLSEVVMKYPQIVVEWVENEGPYRKLLPFLKKFWQKENCVVITCDDDVVYKKNFIETAICLWKEKACCIGFEGSRIHSSLQYNSFISAKGTQDLWNLATGVGGVLYEPKWFTNKAIFDWKDYPYNDDLWFTPWRISANIPCYIHLETSIDRSFSQKEKQSLWTAYNSEKNSDAFEKILHYFVYKGFLQGQDSFFPEELQHLFKWNRYIQTTLLPLIQNEPLEGSLWNKHLTTEPHSSLFQKQKNLFQIAQDLSGTKVCEVGFNAGFSAALWLISNPTIQLICLDLGEHSYTKPTFETLQRDFGDRIQILIGDSRKTMKTLFPGYDLVHVDGGHTEEVAKSDCEQALRILKTQGLLLVDDTNLSAVQEGIKPFLSRLHKIPLNTSTNSTYHHTLYRKIS
jgi:predicted O-methyltransferase YrrM